MDLLSDFLPESLQVASTILTAGSQMARSNAMQAVAARKKAALDFEAQQQEIAAQESSGVALRSAQDETLKAQLIKSSALAKAGASGAGASDPTVMEILARTGGEGAYRSALAMYEGEAQARLDRMRASALRYEGDIAVSDAESSSNMAGMGIGATLLNGGVRALSMYEKFNPSASAYARGPQMPLARSPSASGAWLDAGTTFDAGNA